MSKAENNNKAGKTNLILESMIAISFVMSFFANVISFYLTGNICSIECEPESGNEA